MRNKEEIEKQLSQYGFKVWATLNTNNITQLQAIDDDGINIFITLNDEETFELKWLVPHSIANVNIGKCSPFYNESHFMKMLRKMRSIIIKLKEEI